MSSITKRLYIPVLFLLFLFTIQSVSAENMPGIAGQLQATLARQSPDPVEPGNFLDVYFNVANQGGTINNVVFELIALSPLSLVDSAEKNIGTILARQNTEDAVTLHYKLKIDSKATAGNATLRLRYKSGNNVYTAQTQFADFKIRVREPQAFVTLSVVETEPRELVPGMQGFIKIGLTNFARLTMRNLKITLNTSADTFSGYEESAEKYISTIAPGDTVYETFRVIVSGTAASKVHETPIKLEYEDEIGTKYSRTVTVGLVINDPPQYLMNIEESTIFYKQQNGNVVFSISNIGTSNMKFAVLELLPAPDGEYEILSAPKVYVGNLESDDFETVTYKVHINGVKEAVPFNLLFRYKDNFNNIYNDDVVLNFKIYSKSKAASYGLAQVPSALSSLFSFMIFVLVIVFMVFMVLDWMHNPMQRYKHILWLIVILTPAIGTAVYYFFGRKKAEL
jgi:hypothetical protein